MDPTSFTQTSFCGSTVDNITTNESKGYILNHMSIMCSGKTYQSKYAKLFNERFSKNLRNPHIICLKSGGTPYFMFLTQINETNYCFLIDKKIKEGYDYPKIFILPYQFSSELYKGSLFECELIRKKNKKWCIGINDIYFYCGKNMKKTIIIDRLNTIHNILTKNYKENNFTNTCPLFIKKYFDYKDINFVMNEFAPQLDYDTRGIYFIPLRIDYSNILYIFPKESNPVIMKKETKKITKCFRIMKTMKPDVYDLYLSNGDNIIKQNIALVQTTLLSHTLLQYFENKNYDDEILVECKFNDNFKKWEPISLSDGPINEI